MKQQLVRYCCTRCCGVYKEQRSYCLTSRPAGMVIFGKRTCPRGLEPHWVVL